MSCIDRMQYLNLLKSRFITQTPYRLMHVVTSLCNSKCKLCDQWKKSSKVNDDLTLSDIYKMLNDAKKSGMFVYTAWGGEPLMRKDLNLILSYAKKLNFTTGFITNGFFLKDRCEELMPFTDSIVVSIDSYDDVHDEMRGVKGMKDKAIAGIESWKKYKKNIVINSVICNLNVEKIEGLAKLSKRLSVPISFQPMDIFEGYNESYNLSDKEFKKAFQTIVTLKKAGFNIFNSYSYLKKAFDLNYKFKCHAPKCYIPVDANGDIIHCIHGLNKKWGNIKTDTFTEIFKSNEFKNFCKLSENCNRCRDSCVIEISLAYSLNPFYFIEKLVTSGHISL